MDVIYLHSHALLVERCMIKIFSGDWPIKNGVSIESIL